MSSQQPIEIVGGGLAGLALGLALRRANVPVTLLEAGRYPRHRVCGEFITGLSSTTITRLGLGPYLADALQHRKVAWFFGAASTPALRQNLPAPALGLSRHVLDQRLAHAFVAAGGSLHENTRATDLAPTPGRIFASGRRRATAPWLGLKIHAQGLPLAADLELHLGDHAYIGLARLSGDEVNVCGLFRRRKLCAKGSNLLLGHLAAAGLSPLASRLAGGNLDSASFCAVAAVAFDNAAPPLIPDRLAVGDAHAMIPPFTGNGMAMAFQSAETALDPILTYARGAATWADTCREVALALHRRFRVRLSVAGAIHPFLLQPRRQRLLRRLGQAHLLPLRPLYAALH